MHGLLEELGAVELATQLNKATAQARTTAERIRVQDKEVAIKTLTSKARQDIGRLVDDLDAFTSSLALTKEQTTNAS